MVDASVDLMACLVLPFPALAPLKVTSTESEFI